MKAYYFFLLVFYSFAFSATKPSWNCEEASWKEEPNLEDGIYSATIQTHCFVNEQRKDGIPWLFQKLQNEYQRKEKYEIHEGPLPVKKGNLQGLRYDLTDKLNEEGSDLSIRQNVELLTNLVNELFYSTQSTDIHASGTAQYLKQVSFGTEVKASDGTYEVYLENKVRIERPWFALSLFFKPMSSSITQSKFEIARDKLMEHLLKE